MCKGDGEYDASDEKGMGPTSPFPQPGDFHFEKIVFHDLAQVRTRYPGVEALIRGNALHVDGRRFIWKGQVLTFLSMFSKKALMKSCLLLFQGVEEQSDFAVPTGVDEIEKNIRTQIRRRSKLNLEDLKPTFV